MAIRFRHIFLAALLAAMPPVAALAQGYPGYPYTIMTPDRGAATDYRVAAMRRRRSTSSSSGMLMRKGRIALSSIVPIRESPWFDGSLVGASPAAARCSESRLKAPAAAAVARKLRRVDDDDITDMITLLGEASLAWPRHRLTKLCFDTIISRDRSTLMSAIGT